MPSVNSSALDRNMQGNITALAAGAISNRIVRVPAGASGVALAFGANASTVNAQLGPLYYLSGAVKGGVTAILGDALAISPLRAVTDANACTDPVVVGQALYLTDAGGVDNIPGTIPRKVGTVLSVIDAGARTVTWLFDGSLAGKQMVEESNGTTFLSGLFIKNGHLRLKTRDVTIVDGNIAPYPEVSQQDCVVCILRSAVAGASRHLNMPASPLLGQVIVLKDADASAAASNILIHGNGYDLDGDPTVTWNTNGSWGIVIFNGTRWIRVS